MTSNSERNIWKSMIAHAYQPIVDIQSNQIYCYEALLRSPTGSSPAEVLSQIPAEMLNRFETFNRQLAIERAVNLSISSPLSLNFSLSCLLYRKGDELCELIDFAIEKGLSAEQIIIEVRESDSFTKPDQLIRSLDKARAKGALIAVDDFGAGYAGLNTLIDINPDIVKLDMYLIRDINSCGARQSATRAMVSMCREMGIDLIAEGIEDSIDYYTLSKLGIYLHQGYLLARPGFESLPPFSLPE